MKKSDNLQKLTQIVAKLCGPRGCPWDRAQTHKSLKPHLLEETYEVLEAIDDGDTEKFKEELGDLLLQVVMHAEFARKRGKFSLPDVAKTITEKLVRRHPHVFGKKKARNADEAWKNWEQIKAGEAVTLRGKKKPYSHMEGIPKVLPALARADKAQRKAARVGFDWDQVAGAWEKVHEETREIEEIFAKKTGKNGVPSARTKRLFAEELGDLLFATVNVARKLDLHSEELLQAATNKFIRRFQKMENHFQKTGKELSSHSLKELDAAWERAKAEPHK